MYSHFYLYIISFDLFQDLWVFIQQVIFWKQPRAGMRFSIKPALFVFLAGLSTQLSEQAGEQLPDNRTFIITQSFVSKSFDQVLLMTHVECRIFVKAEDLKARKLKDLSVNQCCWVDFYQILFLVLFQSTVYSENSHKNCSNLCLDIFLKLVKHKYLFLRAFSIKQIQKICHFVNFKN